MKKVITSSKIGTKGYISQSLQFVSKKVQGSKGKDAIKKLTMPVKFSAGANNPIKMGRPTDAFKRLVKACKPLKK